MARWQILDVGSIWMKEFAAALGRLEPIVAWQPRMLATGMLQNWERPLHVSDPALDIVEFPMQRGYARAPLRWMNAFETVMVRRLLDKTSEPERTPLIFSTPFYAPLAELWAGPVAYYSTDLTSAYEGLNPEQVIRLERRMCAAAEWVFPNSARIAHHLEHKAGCAPEKIMIVPNATRSANIAAEPSFVAAPLPADVTDLKRPVLGVLGDLSGNMDWEFLAEAIRLTAGFSWLFVGPYHRAIQDARQREARDWVRHHARFVGAKPYGELQAYARSFDAAVLPYRRKEPTYSGSSTRFYEHLAALRPMIATRGFAELLEKEPLLNLVDRAAELAACAESLRCHDFCDGYEELRWMESRKGTWEARALSVAQKLRVELAEGDALAMMPAR